ncbi:hypothetical protein GALMADRAFT_221345 [Galerina marginata CBS 339.88]|uniref:Uncharacterized protein n=1 Tax=Galerina marginata (strain CBS 339.88) TaxID=685588 RepID=A0A067TE65_GALM3|nr:hypothetical protein GALMADRAFT_221345 [Galerina marginata CBS 339.88]
MAKEPMGFLGRLSRQAFATHRPFRAVILDCRLCGHVYISAPSRSQRSHICITKLAR